MDDWPCSNAQGSAVCKFWLEDDGWNGSTEHPSITVHATSFEQAKSPMELALGKHIESVLNESRPASKGRLLRKRYRFAGNLTRLIR
jgi:hypothetical protein